MNPILQNIIVCLRNKATQDLQEQVQCNNYSRTRTVVAKDVRVCDELLLLLLTDPAAWLAVPVVQKKKKKNTSPTTTIIILLYNN